jgi:hypothetical protein
MNDKQTYMVMDPEGLHDYTIVKEEVATGYKLSLYSSSGHQWSEHARNKCLLTMTDDGYGYVFKPFKKLDYAELSELRILLDFEKAMDDNPKNREKYRIIEDKTLFEA